MHWKNFKHSICVISLSGITLSLISCSDPREEDILIHGEDSLANNPISLEDVPDFSGPWASQFTEEYIRAESDFVREVLADEKITDQELAEMRSKFTECLMGYGFTEISFEPSGGFSLKDLTGMDDELSNDRVLECSNESGESSVGALHSWIRRNPDNLDEHEIMAACLVRKGVVDPSYGAKDYTESFDTESFPYFDQAAGEAARRSCNLDPLGLYG